MTTALVPAYAPQDPGLNRFMPHDPAALGDTIPLIPEQVLRDHHVFVETDTRFRSAARLLQALWREDRDLPIGTLVHANGKRQKLGSRISAAAGEAGGNFLHPSVYKLVRHALIYPEVGALLEPRRLRQNLLSSTGLAFNAFAPLKRSLGLAQRFVEELFPGFIDDVLDLRFEHSPGRGRPMFTADRTAFDLFIRGRTADGRRAFVGIEVKYSESCAEPPQPTHPRHLEIAQASGAFIDPSDPALTSAPLSQFFRLHCLAASMVQQELYDLGWVLVIAPAGNHLVHDAVSRFTSHLRTDPITPVGFTPLTLERTIEAIDGIGAHHHARALFDRHLNLARLDTLLGLEDPASTPVVDDTLPPF